MATGRPVAKTLIKYNKNNLEEHDEEDREPIHIELNEGKTDPYNDKNTIDFRWSDVKKTRKILLWLTSFRIIKANWWENFQISN